MKVTLSYVYKIDNPEDWKTRKCFHFQAVDKIEVLDYNEYKNQQVTIHSKEFPMITYRDGNSYRCRYATEEDLKDYCQIIDNTFIFSQVQKDCVELGKGVWS